MKIAQIVCTFPPHKSGIGNSAYQFAKILSKSGHEITTFTPAQTASGQSWPSIGDTVRLKPWLKYGNGAFLPQLFFRLKKFAVIYLHYPFFGSIEIVWLFKLIYGKKRLIIHYHMDVSGLTIVAKVLSWPSRLIRNSLFKQAEAITCASLNYIQNSDIASFYKKHKNKFYEIPFGVDTDKFRPAKRPAGSLKNSDNIKPLNILFVGGLDQAHYFKGVNILLQSVAKLQPANWQLIIVGDGNLKTQYKKQAKNLNLENKVEFLGNVSEKKLPKIYREANIFVLPSINKNEAFGLVLLEAMATGLPVIASNLPGVRKVFQNNKEGLLVKPLDIDDLKNKIEEIIINGEKRKRMGAAARKLVEEKYSWGKTEERLNKIFFRK